MANKTKKTPLPKNAITQQDVEDDDDDNEDAGNTLSTNKFQAKFAMLASDDEVNDAGDDDNDEVETVKTTTTATASSKKKPVKSKKQASKNKKEDEDLDLILAQIESTSASKKKSDKKKNKQAATTVNEEEANFEDGEGQDLEDILKAIDEKFDEKDRRKEAKKEKKKKKKDEKETTATEVSTTNNQDVEEKPIIEQKPTTIKTEVQEAETDAATGGGDDKKGSSKSKKKAAAEKKAKGGVDAKTLSLMKEFQKKQEEAKLKAMQDVEEKERLEEELQKQHEERLRLEKERREKKKQKEKERIQRKKEDGSYLTKEQREKLERARIQFEAAGIQVPARSTVLTTANNGEQPTKKRVVYDDRRKKNQTNAAKQANNAEPTTRVSQTALTPSETEKSFPAKEEDTLKDDWEQESEEEEIVTNVEDSRTPSTEASRNNFQSETSTPSVATTTEASAKNATNQSSDSESSDDESSSDESDETSSSSDDEETKQMTPFERVRCRLQKRHVTCEGRRSTEVLRAPVICVLGHVDTGKTKILDNLRRTHVQDGEAGGITQQIGATNVPLETIRERTKMCRKLVSREGDYIIPGLLIIDTPGHESFKNLRSRGSSLCDLAILVVDLMHGLEPQTLESIKLLIDRKTPFIVALNKIDRLYNWKGDNKKNIELVIEEQGQNTRNEFEKRCNDVIVQFAEQGLNVALYYKNPDPNEFYSMVPTSAHSGDGMGSLIAMIIEKCQTTLAKRLSYTDELQATVMEVKAIGGLGTTIDVVLVNGHLHVGDTIIVAGQEGPIVTQVRGLLMPEPNRELRVRNQYQNYKTVKAARGIKIAAKDLEKSMAGLPLFVGRKDDEVDYFKNEIQNILKTALSSIKLKENGVYVQASTLGSLEALLEFLKTSNIPYSGINIGPVHRKDIIRSSAQLERDPQWAVVLAFDVRIEKDAQEHADSVGVKIFQADIIYHLFDMFIAHRERVKKENQEKFRHLAVFPCKLKVLPQFIFNSRDPIICGVIVEDGFVKLGTPICVPSKEFIDLGRIVSIELNHKPMEIARKGAEVCIKIESTGGEAPKMFGRHFDENDLLISKISRETIDVVKDHFRDDMQKSDWQLMVDLKKTFNIL
ncbi:hypothetical protein I4U23_006912 [Adineta vaga]|nr:hypothetical protein I4U23_006912 [Adineta vaga]